jgi:hypothetical protein
VGADLRAGDRDGAGEEDHAVSSGWRQMTVEHRRDILYQWT